mgnify:CR=1 FL=1
MNVRHTILCVFAHPDDESYVCGGSIALHTNKGDRVVLVTFTRGEAFTQGRKHRLSKFAVMKLRHRELKRSNSILGIRTSHLLHYSDGKLNKSAQSELRKVVCAYLARYRPETVFSFGPDGLTGHPDHRAIARAAYGALSSWNVAAEIQIALKQFTLPSPARRLLGLL